MRYQSYKVEAAALSMDTSCLCLLHCYATVLCVCCACMCLPFFWCLRLRLSSCTACRSMSVTHVSVDAVPMQSWTDLATDLARKVPSKIDIGPVYTHDPRQRAKYAKGERVTAAAGAAAALCG